MLEDFSIAHPIFKLCIAAVLGGFLGVRREMKAQDSDEHKSFMGIRTMTLLCGMGAISTFLDIPFLILAFFVAILALVTVAHVHGCFSMDRIGITTELSALVAFFIGVLVGKEEFILAVFITIFLASINAFKEHLYRFVRTLTEIEWVGALQLLVVSGIILPFLPRHPIDSWGVFVPFNVWLLIILISGIGFVGYFLIKYFGSKGGIPLTGLLGGLVSSTAVTTSMAAQAKKVKLTEIFIVGILIGLMTMQIRVILEVLILGPKELYFSLSSAPLVMAVAAGIIAYYFFKKNSDRKSFFWETKPEVKIKSPFEIKPALKFGAIFALVIFAAAIGQQYWGSSGVYAAALFSGLIDVDAIVLSSLASIKTGGLDTETAKNAIVIALFTNTIIKAFYVWLIGPKDLAKKIFISVGIISALGLATLTIS